MSSEIVCGPLPIVATLGVFVPPEGSNAHPSAQHYISQDSDAWLSHSTIYYSFLKSDPNTTIDDWQVHLVEEAIAEYTRYANVNLVRTKEGEEESADIRISFDGSGGAWSAIGTDALKMGQGPTMNLGFLSGLPKEGPTDSDQREELYNFTLHQFGHAFGLSHEWKHGARVQLGQNAAVDQHMQPFENADTSNFPEVDEDSIMRFFVPARYTNTGNMKLKGLSKKDKAWLTLIYPGKAGGADADTGILRSLKDLEVPVEPSSRILLSATVSEMRFHYHEYISNMWKDRLNAYHINHAIQSMDSHQLDNLQPESHVLKGKVSGVTPLIDHNSEDDLYDAVAAAVLDPQFSQVLANVVNKDDDGNTGVQNSILGSYSDMSRLFPGGGILSGINPQAPPDVQNFLGPIINVVGGLLGQILFSGLPAHAASGMYPRALPPNVEQGIFSTLGKFVQHPTFINIIKGVTEDMFKQHGLIPGNNQTPPGGRPM